MQYCLYNTACNTVCIAWSFSTGIKLTVCHLITLPSLPYAVVSNEPVPNYLYVCTNIQISQLCGAPSSELFVVQRRRPVVVTYTMTTCTVLKLPGMPDPIWEVNICLPQFTLMFSIQRPNRLLPCWALVNCFWDNVTHVLQAVCIVALWEITRKTLPQRSSSIANESNFILPMPGVMIDVAMNGIDNV